MPLVEELEATEIASIISEVAKVFGPVVVSKQCSNRWASITSRFLGQSGDNLLLQFPGPKDQVGMQFTAGSDVGLLFKYHGLKQTASAKIISQETAKGPQGTVVPAIKVALPSQMQRLNRRAHERTMVPSDVLMRVSFWLGGADSKPLPNSAARPIWAGKMLDISRGGFRVRTNGDCLKMFDSGDLVGTHIVIPADENGIMADAIYRNSDPDGEMVILGFEYADIDAAIMARIVSLISDLKTKSGEGK